MVLKIKYILLKYEYHNNIATQISANLKRQHTFIFYSLLPFGSYWRLFLLQLLQTISSSIINLHSRSHKTTHDYFRLTHYRYSFYCYHHHPVGVDAR